MKAFGRAVFGGTLGLVFCALLHLLHRVSIADPYAIGIVVFTCAAFGALDALQERKPPDS